MLVPLAALLLQAGTLPEVIHVQDGCPSCRITVDTVVVLGDPDGPGMIVDEQNVVAVDAEGRYYVMNRSATSVQIFGPDGGFLAAVGRAGEGPGELLGPQALHVDGRGVLHVLDWRLRRVNVIGADRSPARTIPVADIVPGFDVLPMAGDSVLVTGYAFTPELFGNAVHVFSAEGRLARSFGAPRHAVTSRDPRQLLRTVARARDGGLWVASWDRYEIDRWSLEGERKATLARRPHEDPWFAADTPPGAALVSIQEDSEGLVWVRITAPPEEAGPGEQEVDAVVEVIDPHTATRLASLRLPGPHTRLFGERMIGEPDLDLAEGSLRLRILRLAVGRR